MKSNFFKISLSLLLILVVSFSFSQTSNNIKFEKTTQKFKKVDEGHQIILSYKFTYNGNVALTIIEPEVDCSCTIVVLPKNTINPNTTNTIKIKFDTSDKIGWQEREVLIQFISNTMDSRSIDKKLIFKGMVKANNATKKLYKANKKKK